MPEFFSSDGTRLAYRILGEGEPLICLPGGPGRPSAYLEDLAGLDAERKLILLDTRGTGASDVPADPGTYRGDRLTADVEALRVHLGLETFDLLGHSAAGSVAIMYAASHPGRVHRLVLVTPGLAAAGLDITDEEYFAAVDRLADRDWYPDARAALDAIEAGDATPDNLDRAQPIFRYGAWTPAARAHSARHHGDRSDAVAAGYEGFSPVDVSSITSPTLVIAGEHDPAPTPARAADLAALFPDARLAVAPDSGHSPWVTDPAFFHTTVSAFLR